MLRCPSCGCQRIWKDGIRYVRESQVQRYLCRSCGYRFSETQIKVNVTSQVRKLHHSDPDPPKDDVIPVNLFFKKSTDSLPFPWRENIRSQVKATPQRAVIAQDLNALPSYISSCRVCASEGEAKNLVEVDSRTEKRAAGATKLAGDIKSKLFEFAWYMKKEGLRESTIEPRIRLLKVLVKRGVNLLDPESVKEGIARQETWCEGRQTLSTFTHPSLRCSVSNGTHQLTNELRSYHSFLPKPN